MIKVILDNNNEYIIHLNDSPLRNKITKALKHLQHVKLPHTLFDNKVLYSYNNSVGQLKKYAHILGVNLEIEKINEQSYLNYLHSIYEEKYSSDERNNPDWLFYHEAVHMVEMTQGDVKLKKSLLFDYKNLAGHLNTEYSFNELQNFTLANQPGDLVIEFNELGKTPLKYWKDNEPDNLARFCQLAKPLIRFNFSLKLYLEEHSASTAQETEEFLIWFEKYKKPWCKYWNIPDWSLEQIAGSIKVGYCKDWDKILNELANGAKPVYLKLV